MASALSARGSTRAWRLLRRWVLARDNGICHLCGRGGADSVDHVIARARGGTDDPANLAAAHLRCPDGSGGNIAKGNRASGPVVARQPQPSRRW